MNNQSAAQFRLEPSCLRRHDFSAVGDVHNLLHADRIECECCTHLTAIHTAFQFLKSAQTAYKVDALAGAEVANLENLIKDEP